MGKFYLYAVAVAALMLTSCEKAIIADAEVEDTTEQSALNKKFTFTVKGDFENPTFTRSYLSADGNEMTDLWVIDYKDGEIKQQLHQSADDENWGTPTMSLTLGTHHVYFLASRGTAPQMKNGIVTWTKPLDTFYRDYEVTVVKTSNGNRAVTLDRVASKCIINIEDAIPTGTSAVNFTCSTWNTGYNMITGEPVATTGYKYAFNIPSSWIGKTGASFTLWTLSSPSEWQTDVAIASMQGDIANAQATIPDVPFIQNRATIYRGNLYSGNESSSITLNADWLEAYESVF